jgi:hypothetical protein
MFSVFKLKKFLLLFIIFIPLPFFYSCNGNNGNNIKTFVLFTPLFSTSTYLVNETNTVVQEWTSEYEAGQSAYLLEDGSILRAGKTNDSDNFFVKTINDLPNLVLGFNVGGIVERISADNANEWRFTLFSDTFMPHHDVEMLPNGNVLMILWEYKTPEEAIQAGIDPTLITDNGLWVDAVFEVQPVGNNGGNIVWEWHAWNHLVQDIDPTKDNFGILSENPGKLNINNDNFVLLPADLMHSNSVSYIEELDQIILSSYNYSEFWIIDHTTTTEEASGNSGGKYGKGGEFLYRWGNPSNYGIENSRVFTLSAQHDTNWIADEKHIIMFHNNVDVGNSMVVEMVPPLLPDGTYEINSEGFYGPLSPIFTADLGFQEPVLGTAQRLANGNTFSCECTENISILLNSDGNIISSRNVSENIELDEDGAFRLLFYPGDFSGVIEAIK